jgi:hypothetical protein
MSSASAQQIQAFLFVEPQFKQMGSSSFMPPSSAFLIKAFNVTNLYILAIGFPQRFDNSFNYYLYHIIPLLPHNMTDKEHLCPIL